MVAELEDALGTTARMVEGGRGIFDVKVGGDLVFSKHELGRFPVPGEVAKLLESRS
ncbi:MAG: Rdx family protein [Nannocystaceae bacterium]|nr:Rdx family protein [Nannocystaceae bacterium]